MINLATSATAKLKKIWTNNNIETATKIRLYKSLDVSVLTYGCGSWTLKAESERRIAAFQMKFFRILKKKFLQRPHNKYISNAITKAAGPHEPLLATVKCRKLKQPDTTHLPKKYYKAWSKAAAKGGRPQKMYVDNIREWTGLEPQELCNAVHNRPRWKKITVEPSKCVPLRSRFNKICHPSQRPRWQVDKEAIGLSRVQQCSSTYNPPS